MTRLSTRFTLVQAKASRTFPWLSLWPTAVQMRWCPQVDREHEKSWRQFAHSCHHGNAVCWARAAESELTDAEMDGIAAHELGHIVAEALGLKHHSAARRRGKGDEGAEREANLVALSMGFRIRYNDRSLEEVF